MLTVSIVLPMMLVYKFLRRYAEYDSISVNNSL